MMHQHSKIFKSRIIIFKQIVISLMLLLINFLKLPIKQYGRYFPGGSVVEEPAFQRRGCRFNPW